MVTYHRRVHSRPRSLTAQLRKAIKNSGLSQYRIAQDTGVPQPVVNRFVNGERSITLETADKLCAYLKLKLR